MAEPILLRPVERGGGVDVCHSCGQALPKSGEYLTDRELDILTGWWLSGSVKEAAQLAGVGEQRAKNLLSAARTRNRAGSNPELLAMHYVDVRKSALRRLQHKIGERKFPDDPARSRRTRATRRRGPKRGTEGGTSVT